MAINAKQLYAIALECTKEVDPRGKERIEKIVLDEQKAFDSLPEGNQKKYFEAVRKEHPYIDSQLLYDTGKPIQKIMVGVDCEGPELLLADRLNEKGENIDFVLAHHPAAQALIGLDYVMDCQIDTLIAVGVSAARAEQAMKPRMQKINRALSPGNHMRAVAFAKLLGISFGSMHTMADLFVQRYLEDYFAKTPVETLDDVIDALFEIPEYQMSAANNSLPAIWCGESKSRAGKMIYEMAGGTSGDIKNYKALADAGISTIVSMHMEEAHLKECKRVGLNVLIAGHMSSDSLGINLLLDAIQKKSVQKFDIVPVSGFLYNSRL